MVHVNLHSYQIDGWEILRRLYRKFFIVSKKGRYRKLHGYQSGPTEGLWQIKLDFVECDSEIVGSRKLGRPWLCLHERAHVRKWALLIAITGMPFYDRRIMPLKILPRFSIVHTLLPPFTSDIWTPYGKIFLQFKWEGRRDCNDQRLWTLK